MATRPVRIAIVDNLREQAEERNLVIRKRQDWPARVETEIFTNADDLIDAFEKGNKFFDVIISDILMPKRGDDPRQDGTAEEGGIRIKLWLQEKRASNEEYRCVQLRWNSRNAHVGAFLHKHVNAATHSWLQYVSHHEKESYYEGDFILMVDMAIRMSDQSVFDFSMPMNMHFNSSAMISVVQKATKAARSNANVLITGPSGVGKGCLARYIHGESRRKAGIYKDINCAAIPEPLIESALFGHVKGSFTGAITDRTGMFAQSNGGTLFLDEIGEMSKHLQASLLKVIESRTWSPVGSDEVLKADFRLICATHRDLVEEVKHSRFREDLFYRMNVIHLHIPPLGERPEDIPLLANHFLHVFRQAENKGLLTLSDAAMQLLCQYPWPGSARELQNVIEQAVVLFNGWEGTIEPTDLPKEVFADADKMQGGVLDPEEMRVWSALVASDNNLTKAGASLRISKQAVSKYIHAKNSKGYFVHPVLRRLFVQASAAAKARHEDQ